MRNTGMTSHGKMVSIVYAVLPGEHSM